MSNTLQGFGFFRASTVGSVGYSPGMADDDNVAALRGHAVFVGAVCPLQELLLFLNGEVALVGA